MLRLNRRTWIQLAVLSLVTVLSCGASVFPHRGSDVGQVKSVDVTATGVRAVLAMRSGVTVPSDVQASVHSRSAIGEQYIELTPRPEKDKEHSRPLRAGDVIPAGRVEVHVDIG